MSDLDIGESLTEHPAAEELAAYLSDALAPAGRAVLEAHLAECRECRRQVTSARRLLRQQHAPKRALWLVPAAAAAVWAIALVARGPQPSIGDPPIRTDSGAEGSEGRTIAIVAPADGDTVGPGTMVFAWQGQPGAPLFRINLTEGSGRSVWNGETTDTTVALPAAVTLEPGHSYFWTVDALSADGRSLTTRYHRFLTRP